MDLTGKTSIWLNVMSILAEMNLSKPVFCRYLVVELVHDFRSTPLKSNIDTKNDVFFMYHLSNRAILGIHVSFRWCRPWVVSPTQYPVANKGL